MATKLTNEILLELGFKEHFSLIQNSFDLVLIDKLDYFKSLSLRLCNDKGHGEYYVFMRNGESPNRWKDEIVTITCNMQYKEDLEQLIRIVNL